MAGEGKKSAKFWAPTLRRPTLRGPTTSGPHFSGFGGPTLRGPTTSGPHFSGFGPTPFGAPHMTQKYQPKNWIGQNWIGQNWIGQNWIGQNWLWPKLAGPKPRRPKMDWPKLDWPKLVKSGWPKRDWPKSASSARVYVVQISHRHSKVFLEESLTDTREWNQHIVLRKLIGSILEVIREDLRINDELSDVAAFSAGPSPHEDCLAEDVFFMT